MKTSFDSAKNLMLHHMVNVCHLMCVQIFFVWGFFFSCMHFFFFCKQKTVAPSQRLVY